MMDRFRRRHRHRRFLERSLLLLCAALAAPGAVSGPTARADQVVLKNGGIIRGIVERDNAIVTVYDGLKRTVIRQTKIEQVAPEPPAARQELERFSLIQPIEVHGGEMPSHALRIRTAPWDEFGQRLFEFSKYTGRTLRADRMKQAINEIGPDIVKFRGIDGFWLGQVATDQVPRDVILGLLDRVDPTNKNERLRVARFLIQAKWYDEALAELERLDSSFPELSGTIANVRLTVRDLQTQQALDEADRLVTIGQPRAAEALLTTFNAEGASITLRDGVQTKLRQLQTDQGAHRAFASELRSLLDSAPEPIALDLRPETFELLQALADAPDAVAPRVAPGRALAEADGTPIPPEVRLSRALSSWAVGAEHTLDDPAAVKDLWQTRARVLAYLSSTDPADRDRLLAELQGGSPDDPESTAEPADLGQISRIIRHLPPPMAGGDVPAGGVPLIRRVIDDVNPTPTEYAVLLPPEYHPLRTYPAVVALHDGRGARSALDWWGPEAARNGFVVIAPEYMAPSESPDYRYSADEHAAVMLSLRDARKRFSIDPDRVFLGGSMLGGNAAWDIGLAHPDVFAGVATLSGLPAKHVARTRAHGDYVPLLIVIGDLATASTESLVFDLAKSMMSKAWDVTYVEYIKRGLEPLPEELPAVFDWMKHRTRETHRKDFEVVASRPSDDRYYGLVIRDFAPGRTPAPEAVDPLGSKLDPATISCKVSTLSNLMALSVSGINAIDIWLAPEYFNFDERIQIRINGKRLFNDRVKPDLRALLEDVRIRGDRTQLYWAKLPLGGKRAG
ncbi:alpha/beta hydrolase [Tautonia sp. JC769]|uniref:alpha/beta hydrolase n=1 Tax=Tautonia sp. JC769 TaxID=3232135 RepID=UPI003457F4EA